ncbi:MAG: enoyl-CoA hydratase/isomerase family protein [Alphaproteobacteria bacterium]|nr:enoyl-CoA hydratase/isomerase family protein [Alphaproteobacteria bacterium]
MRRPEPPLARTAKQETTVEPTQLKLDIADGVATVTLARPPVNAMSRQLRLELMDTFDSLNDRADVRCIVLTSAGKVFCAGADIKERAAIADQPGDHGRLNRLVREVFYSVMECSKPVIAAVNGPAIGAGFALVLCCDILLASEDATFAMPEIDVGMAGGVKFLQRHFSPSYSRWLMLTGERVSAAELHRLGVIQSAVPAAALPEAAAKLARTIAAKSPLAVKVIKESFSTVESMSLRDGYRLEQNKTVELNRTEDAKEAKRAFIEKRKPNFVGR